MSVAFSEKAVLRRVIPITVHDLFVLMNYISVVVLFVCCAVIATHSVSRMQKYALLVCISLAACCLGFLFRSEAKDAAEFMIGQKLVYMFVTHGMFLMLLFILEYCKFSIPKWMHWVFHGINFLMSFAVLTLDRHPFFYRSYWAVPMDGYVIVEKEYGFLHTVVVGLFALYMAAAVIITIIFSVKNIRRRSRYVWRILIAVMLPCVSYIIPKLLDSENDLQPIAFAAFSVLVLIMIYKNNLYDIDNIAARFSIASIDEGFIVFDDRYHFEGCNRCAEALFPVLKNLNIDCDIRTEDETVTALLDGRVSEYRTDDKIYDVSVTAVSEGLFEHGKVVKLEDVTLQRHYTDLLRASKETLESEVVTLSGYSYTDDMTGIANRRSFEDAIKELREQGTTDNLVIGLADINGLKETNDNLCHAAGDELIRATATLIERVFRDYGRVFRTGGDEFYIILTAVPDNFDALTERLDREVENWRGELVERLSISYGFVFGRESEAENVDKLLIEADKAMYANKWAYYSREGIDRRRAR